MEWIFLYLYSRDRKLAFWYVLYIMDSMELGKGNSNILKDNSNMHLPIKDSLYLHLGYDKVSKLITALYMVTDIMDKGEPIRHELRTLGAIILKDINLLNSYNLRDTGLKVSQNIGAIFSFLDLTTSMGMISQMNANILRKEFSELNQSLEKSMTLNIPFLSRGESLEQFLSSSDIGRATLPSHTPMSDRQVYDQKSIGHRKQGFEVSTRIGVQKGETFMRALSDKISTLKETGVGKKDNFDLVKKERRSVIIETIKKANISQKESTGLTITDIRAGGGATLKDTSEKTLQRELISMVKDNVLYKTGEKRWSKYFIKNA
jgi:hypothetical protein